MASSYLTALVVGNHQLELPVYLPDATYGVVRSVDADDLRGCQVQAVVMNTFHLMQRPGSSVIQALGGLHRMSGWQGLIMTDSGGFQAYSLIHQNPKYGTISDEGLVFRPEGANRKYQLTPEKCIQLQLSYGSDVVICLDDCTHVDAPYEAQRVSVQRTVAWAKRCKSEFLKLVTQKRLSVENRPKLFAVIQGGGIRDLRRQCAEQLLEIGFDGYGYGGWPLDGEGNLLTDMLEYTRELVPVQYPLHALGVGQPQNVVVCYELGYGLFDSAMPTRDARHGRLYAFTTPPSALDGGLKDNWFRYIYIDDERYMRSDEPVSPGCDCLCCRRYSLGYLRHLFKLNDSLYPRLATIHNLRFMTQLTALLRMRGL